MNKLTPSEKNSLYKFIVATYNITEMEGLCWNLEVDPESVGSTTTKEAFARDLIDYFDRNGQKDELMAQVNREKRAWFENTASTEPVNPDDYDDSYVDSTAGSNDDGCLRTLILAIIVLVIIVFGFSKYQGFRTENRLREPDQFVTNYFGLLNRGVLSHSDAWENLSGDYRVNKHPTGFGPYSEYWGSFKNIEVLRFNVLEETGISASVEVFLTLTKLDDTVENQSSVYRLTRATVEDPWIITDSSP